MRVAKLIETTRKNIRKKYQLLKDHDAKTLQMINKTYAPIIEPLQTLAENKKIKNMNPNLSIDKYEDEGEEEEEEVLEDVGEQEVLEDEGEAVAVREEEEESIEPDLMDFQESVEDRASKRKAPDSSLIQDESIVEHNPKRIAYSHVGGVGPIAIKIANDLAQNPLKYDDVFGPQFVGDARFLGSKKIVVKSDDSLLIGSRNFKGTEGLFNLIYYKKLERPFSNEDEFEREDNCLERGKIYSIDKKIYRSRFRRHRNRQPFG